MKSTLPARPVRRIKMPKPVATATRILADSDKSLLDIVDNLLHQGVMLNGELTIGVANVDLVYLRLSALLCTVDRVLPELAKERPGRRQRRKRPLER